MPTLAVTAAISPPLALGWEQPGLLIWGLAAAAPLLIHLLFRRRHQIARWAAMDFLLAAARRQSRRIRLENWLLLVLRTLIVLVFVVAVASPYRDEQKPVASSDERVHTVYVVDASFSMAQRLGAASPPPSAGRPGDGTLFQLAKALIASDVNSEARRGDAFSLVLMGSPAKSVVREPTTDRAAFVDAVNALELPHGRADVVGAVSAAQEIVAAAPKLWPEASRQEVVFLTDLGRKAWIAPGGDSAQAALHERFTQLATAADIRIADLGASAAGIHGNRADNVAIAQLALTESLALAGAPVGVEATIRSFADSPRGDLGVELLVDGNRVAQQNVSIATALGQATARFDYRFTSAGPHVLEARLTAGDEDLEIDNRRALVVRVRDHVRTLCVSGKPGAADFVRAAAAPGPKTAAGFEAQVVSPAQLRDPRALDDVDVVALCNVTALGDEEADVLRGFLRSGRGVVWFLGDQTAPADANRWTTGGTRLLPALVGDASTWGQYRIDPLNYEHPILRPYQGQQDTTLAQTPIARYVKLALPPNIAARVVMKVSPTGDPLMVEQMIDSGRVVVVATDGSLSSVDPATKEPWTYWPVWQSFLPVVQETLRFAMAASDERLQGVVGMPIGGEIVAQGTSAAALLAATGNSRPVMVQGPASGKRPEPATITPQGGRLVWSYADTGTSGVYRVATPSAEDHEEFFAVNVDTAESDLRRATREDLTPGVAVVTGSLGEAARSTTTASRRDDWHKPLLYGLLGLLIAESACAWLLGRRMA